MKLSIFYFEVFFLFFFNDAIYLFQIETNDFSTDPSGMFCFALTLNINILRFCKFMEILQHFVLTTNINY